MCSSDLQEHCENFFHLVVLGFVWNGWVKRKKQNGEKDDAKDGKRSVDFSLPSLYPPCKVILGKLLCQGVDSAQFLGIYQMPKMRDYRLIYTRKNSLQATTHKKNNFFS